RSRSRRRAGQDRQQRHRPAYRGTGAIDRLRRRQIASTTSTLRSRTQRDSSSPRTRTFARARKPKALHGAVYPSGIESSLLGTAQAFSLTSKVCVATLARFVI